MKLQRFKVLLDGDFPCPSIQDMENGDILPLQSLEIVMAEDVAILEDELKTLRAELASVRPDLNALRDGNLMLWASGREEDNACEEPWEIAERFADDCLKPGEDGVVEVQAAARLPDRKMRVWVDENANMGWEWVE